MPIIIDVKAVPSSGYSKIIMDKSGSIKCYLKAAPEDGKANKELIKLLAESLDLKAMDISIVAGLTSRKKKIRIETRLTLNELLHKLGLEFGQLSLK